MSRNAAAAELQAIIAQIQDLAQRGGRLAEASGGLVSPTPFRAALAAAVVAAGELDAKGLLVQPLVQA